MPRLVVEKGPQKGNTLKIDKTSAVIVGRGSTASLQLDDPMASRRHFSVEYKKSNFHIIDLGSANGTYVNGEEIREKILEIGDKIQAGEVLLSFLADQSTIKHDTITGQNIGGYLIEERVGRGAMGTVYKAVQLSLDRTVALKILARELVNDKNFIDMFVREAQNAGQLNHANIVQVYDVGQHNNIYFISMEYMANGSVYELINREGAQSFERAIEIAIQSARGLRYAEKRGIVHRDIKPDNLMLGLDGTTKIGDLGIARRLQAGTAVAEEGIFGSPHYMAPEQAQGLKIDCRTDIYSLGATMHHILTGKTPFTGKSPQEIILKQINEQPPKVLEVNPVVPDELAEVVEKCMLKNPDERYQSSEDLLEDLEQLQSKSASLRIRVPLKERARELKKKYFVPAVVILAAAILAAVGFFSFRYYQHSSLGYQVKLDKAKQELAQAQALFKDESLDKALKAAEELEKKYPEFPEIVNGAEQLVGNVNKRKAEKEVLSREKKSEEALETARNFERTNPNKLTETVDRYKEVISSFPDSKAAVQAREEVRRLGRIIEEKSMLEIGAQAQANAILSRSRNFKARRMYGRALEELAGFKEEYRGTDAAREIEAEKSRIASEVDESFKQVKDEVNRLMKGKRYEDARALILKAVSTYEIVEITDAASKIVEQIDKLIEQQKTMQEQATLMQDIKKYNESVKKARQMILEHRFVGAASEYSSLQLLLKSEKYRNISRIKFEEIEQITTAKKTLIDQINQNKLRTPIRLKINRLNATATRATEDKLVARFDNSKGEADCPWKSFKQDEMVSFLKACSLDARGHLAAGVYAKELGDSSSALIHFQKAVELDSSLKRDMEKFSGDLK